MDTEFLMKPKVDYAFKEIMMDDKARLGFLSAVLRIPPEDIKETRILNTHLRKVHEDDKEGILDIRTSLNDDTEIDTEIQLMKLEVWPERSLFYVSKMYVEQIKPGQDYTVFKKCVNISILDFTLFSDNPNFYSCFHIREDSRHTLYTDKMEFHVIELPKLPQENTEHGNTVLSWAKFISAERKEDFDVIAKESPYIASAYEQLQVISQDKEKRLAYDARLKAQLDQNQLVKEAEQRGITEGMAKGREEGRAEGIAEGVVKGREEGRAEGMVKGREEGRAEGMTVGVKQGQRAFIVKMLKKKPIEQVAEDLEISVEEAESILADD